MAGIINCLKKIKGLSEDRIREILGNPENLDEVSDSDVTEAFNEHVQNRNENIRETLSSVRDQLSKNETLSEEDLNILNNQKPQEDGKTNERGSETESEGEYVQRDDENVQSTNPDNEERADDRAQEPDAQETERVRPDEPDVEDVADGNTESQDNVEQNLVDQGWERVQTGMKDFGKSFEEAFNDVKENLIKQGITEQRLLDGIYARKSQAFDDLNTVKTGEAYFASERMSIFFKGIKDWSIRNFKAGGPDIDVYNQLVKKDGYIQKQNNLVKINNKRLNKLTRKLTPADKVAVDDMLRGGSMDLLSDNIPQELKEEIAVVTKRMRDHLDGLSNKLIETGLFSNSFVDTIRDNEGKYVNRIYLRNFDKNWHKNVPKPIFENAKKHYRDKLIKSVNDGRVSEANRQAYIKILADDEILDNYLREILKGGVNDFFYPSGAIEGTKDVSFTKARSEIPEVVRQFYGEVDDAGFNYANTVSKIASFLAGTQFFEDLQKVGKDRFISDVPKGDWVKVNKSGSKTLEPLEKAIYVRPDVYKHLEIIRDNGNWWIDKFLKFNGIVKAGKTIYSPVTQLRNASSAIFWMVANGHWNPKYFVGKDGALGLIYNARRFSEDGLTSTNKEWLRLVELGVTDQNVIAKEILNDYFGGIKDTSLDRWFKQKAPTLLKAIIEKPRQFYSDTDDFYRIASYLSERDRYSKGIYKDSFKNLNEEQRLHIEELSAAIVRDTYPNYSKIFPIVSKIRKFPFLGAFVSFSAEMIRTTANQLTLGIHESRNSNPDIRSIGYKRLVGLGAVATFTGLAPQLFSKLAGFGDDEQKDLIEYRAPWEESIIAVDDLGAGKFRYVNPATANPYVYFSDIINAGINAGDFKEGMVQSFLRGLEPFLGPEVSVEVIGSSLLDIINEDNTDNRLEKIEAFSKDVIKGLQPGFTYSFNRVFFPKVTDEELEENPNIKHERRMNEILSFTGYRISEMDVPKNFKLSKGKMLLKQKRKARKDFNSLLYARNKPTQKALDEQYQESQEIYQKFLDDSRENVSRMRRLGISDEVLINLHKDRSVNFDNTIFSEAERKYIFGETDVKPELIFENYNKKSTGSLRRSRRGRSTRRGRRRG